MPDDYKRKRIVVALRDRVQHIKRENSFDTDAGDRVYTGPKKLTSPTELPAIAMVVARSETLAQGRQAHIRLPVQFQALVSADLDDPLEPIESLIGDIKAAVFGPEDNADDKKLGGLAAEFEMGEVEPLDREEGSLVVGAQVEVIVTYVETRGNPRA